MDEVILHHGGPLDGQPVGNPVTGEDPPIPPDAKGYYEYHARREFLPGFAA